MINDFRCPACGRNVRGTEKRCASCNAWLLVEVRVDAANLDPKAVYLAAKAIDMIGPGAPDFEAVRLHLRTTPSTVVPECTPAMGRRICGILERHGITAYSLPLRRPREKAPAEGIPLARLTIRFRRLRESFFRLGRLAQAGIVIAAVSIVVLPVLLAGSVLKETAAEDLPADRSGAAAPVHRDVVFAAIGATVELSSNHGRGGVGFFVEPGAVVTVSGAVGPVGSPVSLVNGGNSELRGTVGSRDGWTGLAVIDVHPATGRFLDLGDATTVERGEPVTVVARPETGRLTAAGAVVVDNRSTDLGRLVFRLDGGDGVAGAPVLNRLGRVVAVVAEGLSDGPGRSLTAIPIAYLMGSKAWTRRGDEAERRRWRNTVATIERADADAFNRARRTVGTPFLIGARSRGGGEIDAEIRVFTAGRPALEPMEFEIRRGAVILDTVEAAAPSFWTPIPADDEPRIERLISWYEHHHVPGRFFRTRLRIQTSPSPTELEGATLVLRTGAGADSRVTIGR